MNAKILVVVGILIVVAVLIGLGSGHLMPGMPVDVAEAQTGPIREFVDERGMTRLPETYLITMPIAGRIEAISLTEDSPVKKDQVVAQIVPRDLELSVEEATAAVNRLDARIRESGYKKVEEKMKEQTIQFVKSMIETVKAANARVKAGEARLTYANQNLERLTTLAEPRGNRSVITQDELDRATSDQQQALWGKEQDVFVYAATKAMEAATGLMPEMVSLYMDRKDLTKNVVEKQKAEAEIELQRVLQDKDRGTMCSPVDGVVLKRFVSNERFLAAGESLLEIGRLEDLEVEADILSLDVVEAKVGDIVEIYGPAIGREAVRGKIHRIYPAGFTKVSSLGVEQQRVKVIIHFVPEDLKRVREQRNLGVGYRVRVRIVTADKADTLTIPRSALFRGPDGQWQVYAVRDGVAVIENVQVGLLNDEKAEILSKNIAAGDQVVLAPESQLTDGARVDPNERKAAE